MSKAADYVVALRNLTVSTVSSNVVTLSTNAAERLRVDVNGKVGIGTTGPAATLHAVGTAGQVRIGPSSGNETSIDYMKADGVTLGYRVGYEDAQNHFFWYNGSTTLALTDAGRLGIGTSVPSTTLDVAGTYRATQGVPVRTAGGNNVTLALTDNGHLIRCANSTSAMNIHIPTNASVAFPTGAEISFMNELTHASANTLGFSVAAGVTLRGKDNSGLVANTVAERWTTAVLKKLATDEWVLIGNITNT